MDREGSNLWAKIMAIPVLAVFLGVAILMARIAYDWSPRQTDSLIGGGLAICGASLAIFAMVTGLIVGIGFYRRLQLDRDQQPGQWSQQRPSLGYREPAPPMIEASKQGSWASNGLASYDLWPEEQPLEQSWRDGHG